EGGAFRRFGRLARTDGRGGRTCSCPAHRGLDVATDDPAGGTGALDGTQVDVVLFGDLAGQRRGENTVGFGAREAVVRIACRRGRCRRGRTGGRGLCGRCRTGTLGGACLRRGGGGGACGGLDGFAWLGEHHDHRADGHGLSFGDR